MFAISWMDLLILSLASFRFTHLIVYDDVTSFLRHPFFEVESREDDNGQIYHEVKIKGTGFTRFMGVLLSCHWCVGVWSTLIMILLYYFVPGAQYLLLLLAIAGIAAVIETKV